MCSDAIRYCVPLVFLMLLTCPSCSVKEDREICPCFLTVVRPDSEAGLQGEVFWYLAAGDYMLEGKIEDGEKQACDIEVPRTVFRLIAVSGITGGLSQISGFRIEEGESCPPVYCYRAELDTRCNSLRDTIRLHKNYCRVTVRGGFPDSFTYMLEGQSCGFDWEGNIIQGRFHSYFNYGEGGFYCNVPRQADSSLRLDLLREGELLRSFPLGDLIAQSGYDWEAEDLEDIEISLDYQDTGVNFNIDGWTHRLTFYYEF